MRKLKPSILTILGFVWLSLSIFLITGIEYAFPKLNDRAMSVISSAVDIPTVVLFVAALALSRAKKDDFARGNLLKYLTPAQICLLGGVLTFVIAFAVDGPSEGESALFGFISLLHAGLTGAATVLSCVGFFKKRKAAAREAEEREKFELLASRSGRQESIPEDEYHVECASCGEEHPSSDMILIWGVYLCHNCFSAQFAPDLREGDDAANTLSRLTESPNENTAGS